jgi:hypothetical protein
MPDITVTVDDRTVYEQGVNMRIVHTCATRRVAQVLAATIALRVNGWVVVPISTSSYPRLPLLLPGEEFRQLLDGSLSDLRAQGFSASRGGGVLRVDACAGMSLRIVGASGDPTEALEICHWYLGS